ncbi:MAG: hypothetical protein WC080_02515 [Patescibacteria group bacterium]|jgi:hypothetical protein
MIKYTAKTGTKGQAITIIIDPAKVKIEDTKYEKSVINLIMKPVNLEAKFRVQALNFSCRVRPS